MTERSLKNEAAELDALIRAGRKIEAIRRLRELTGMDLRDAKDAIERIDSQAAAQVQLHRTRPAPTAPVLLDPEVRLLAQQGQRIEAIRLLRERKRLGLKEARDAVDAAVPPPRGRGAGLLWLAITVILAGVVAAMLLD